ncbi:hypothetical protein FVF58_24230 [Paraburkholderia panacisoli]|uniref:Uncharacterized protein n=1 Tax=Paraburkholderia panacisoli TaxID=2603818 RepID=A0A5B0GWI4_9BURK|nr:hypothetical protein [Paraburkholderia panacisoli]KAA1007243.1 hypothetical protein FVF58_24230 [Paraburkholderia panacisoli]
MAALVEAGNGVAERMLPALSWDFLCFLHEKGGTVVGAWLATNDNTVRQCSSIDIHNELR